MTERAVFELTEAGMLLKELAPGVDLQADVLERMDFTPILPPAIPPMPLLERQVTALAGRGESKIGSINQSRERMVNSSSDTRDRILLPKMAP